MDVGDRREYKYVMLEDGSVRPEPDTTKWAEWVNTRRSRIAYTRLGEAHISTVFLDVDHNFSMIGLPILFETMNFSTDTKNHYHTRAEAMQGHFWAVANNMILINRLGAGADIIEMTLDKRFWIDINEVSTALPGDPTWEGRHAFIMALEPYIGPYL